MGNKNIKITAVLNEKPGVKLAVKAFIALARQLQADELEAAGKYNEARALRRQR